MSLAQDRQSMTPAPLRVSHWERTIYVLIVLGCLAVSAGGAWFYQAQERQARRAVEANLEAVARLKTDQIVEWRDARLGDAAVLMESPFFKEGVKLWMANPQAGLAEKILQRFRSTQQHYRYRDVLLVDGNGQVRLSTSGRTGALHAEEQQALSTALREQGPVLSDLHAGSGEARPQASLVAPLLENTGAGRRLIGAILLTIDAQEFLYPLIQSWPTPSVSAETLLVRREGDSVLFLNDLLNRPQAALKMRIPLSQQEVPAVMAALGKEGVFRGSDYRGVKVLSVLKQIPGTTWGMVAKMDEAEALAEWRARAGLIMAAVLALALALLVTSLMVWQQRNKYRALSGSARVLRASELGYRRLFEAASDGILILDAETGKVVDVNPCLVKLLGFSREALLAKNGWELGLPQDIVASQANFEQLQEQEYVRYGDLPLQTADGQRLEVEIVGNAYLVGDRKLVQCTIRDITERKRADALLQLQAAALDAAANAIVITDSEHKISWVNRAFCTLTGYSAEEVIGQNPRLLNAGVQDTEFYRGMYQTIMAGSVWQGEMVNRYKDGRLGVEQMTITPLRGDDGAITHCIAIKVDITERKRAEQAQAQLLAIIEATPDLVATGDPQGHVIYYNRAGLRMLGFEQGLDPSTVRFLDTHPDWAAKLIAETAIPHAIEHGTWSGETALLGRDGGEIPVSQVLIAHKAADGSVGYLSTIARDITERKRAEEKIRALNTDLERRVAERTQQLVEANRAKSDFLANMSHELRTPLNAIIGCSEMLQDGALGELEAKQRGFVADIFGAGTHLLSLINDILDLSKVEAGMLQIDPGAVDAPALLKASLLVVREKAFAHRIRLDARIDPALGTLLADERKLKQIVYNLLSNAVKFTPEGGAVTLSARRCARAEVVFDETVPARLIPLPPGDEGEFLAVTVEDSGAGIAAEHLPKLFEPFTQLDDSLSRSQPGTGLGLSLVRRLAELHGGTVGVASRPGGGSRFCVWLPYREVAIAAPEGRSATEGARSSARAAPLALVIEDEDRMAELLAELLRAEGFEVMRAATAEEGLVRAAKSKPQLITLDIFLPAMDGWEFMRRLNADPAIAHTPVVIVSVSDDRGRGLALGARRVLRKPVAREELVAALAGLVKARPGGEPVRVLVADDNVQAVELLATALEAEAYRVLPAYGGAEAIELARRVRPDLAILDLMMPEVSGFEVAQALRDSEHTAHIPILVLTAKDLTAGDRARLNGEVSAILAKSSIDTSELLVEVRRALSQRAAG
jgi:PAS domain S-box-containing protein